MNHSHVLYDSDPHFKIDPISRNLINESSKKVRLIQHDHNSERFTFESPRYIEGHDLSTCNKVEIHYLNIESNTKIQRAGVYTVDDLQIKSDDESTVVCSWVVGNNATLSVGQLQFLIRFSCVSESTGEVEYVWNTAVYSGITISSGIYNNDSASDNPVPPYNLVTTVNGRTVRLFIGTQAEYDAISEKDANTIYYITDDDTLSDIAEDIENAISELTTKLTTGEIAVGKVNATFITIKDVSTLKDIDKLINDKKSCYINIKADITINGVLFPKYSKGWLSSADDGVISVIGADGITYTAYRSSGSWINARKSDVARYASEANTATKANIATSAEYLYNNGHTFGRVELWNNPVLIYSQGCIGWMQDNFTNISLPSNLKNKKLIVNITKLTSELIGGVTYYSRAYSFHTPVFRISEAGQAGEYSYINGANFTFRIDDGSTLYFKVSSGNYVIESVYEEL